FLDTFSSPPIRSAYDFIRGETGFLNRKLWGNLKDNFERSRKYPSCSADHVPSGRRGALPRRRTDRTRCPGSRGVCRGAPPAAVCPGWGKQSGCRRLRVSRTGAEDRLIWSQDGG